MGAGRSVGTVSSLRATVFVGETWNDTVVENPMELWTEDEEAPSLSFALPPRAVGALWEVFLLPMYTPRPMPPAMHCANSRQSYKNGRSDR